MLIHNMYYHHVICHQNLARIFDVGVKDNRQNNLIIYFWLLCRLQ